MVFERAAGYDRNYWDFYLGFGYFCTALLLFAALVAAVLAEFGESTEGPVVLLRWALAVTFIAAAMLVRAVAFHAHRIFFSFSHVIYALRRRTNTFSVSRSCSAGLWLCL